MANDGKLDVSTRANQYLNLEEAVSEDISGPVVDVPVDIGYSLDRYVNSHLHAEDKHLRQLRSPTPLTEAESVARMAAIIKSLVPDTAQQQQQQQQQQQN